MSNTPLLMEVLTRNRSNKLGLRPTDLWMLNSKFVCYPLWHIAVMPNPNKFRRKDRVGQQIDSGDFLKDPPPSQSYGLVQASKGQFPDQPNANFSRADQHR
jgi:hypothetical protein